MSTLFPSLQAAEPFVREPVRGQAIAVAILAAGAIAATVWAGHGAAAPKPPETVRANVDWVSSGQLETARLRIRYADAAATSAAYGGSVSVTGKTARADAAALGAAGLALHSMWRDFARLCGTVAA